MANQGLDVNNEVVETTVVDVVDVGELEVDHVGSMGDEGFDLVGVKSVTSKRSGMSWFTSW